MRRFIHTFSLMFVLVTLFLTVSYAANGEFCNHNTRNGQCGLCGYYIVEKGQVLDLEYKTRENYGEVTLYYGSNEARNIVELTNGFNGFESSSNDGFYFTFTNYIRGLTLGKVAVLLGYPTQNGEYFSVLDIYYVEVVEHVHLFDEEILYPTCWGEGYRTLTCRECGHIVSEKFPMLNHPNAIDDKGARATCDLVGFTPGKYCPDCDTWLEGHEMIPTTAHSYTSEVTTEPTCFKDGITTYTCACGDSYTETIAKKEHEYSSWEVKTKPTCTKAGLEWSYCLNCDNDFEREIPALGHEIIEYVMRASTDEMAAYGGDGAYITACDTCSEIFKQDFFARPAEYKLSTSAYTYNGNVRKPTVTVKDADGKTLVEGQDYDVIYPDSMKLPGKYDVTVFFKGNYLGEKKLSVTIKPKATTDLKAKTQDTKTITLSWSKTTGASDYEVYKYNSSTKKYVKIKTTTSTSYKVTSLTAGTTYKFKVRAYKKIDDETKVFGGYSSVFSTATKTAKPTIKTATQSNGKVKLIWDNVSGESGYEIYYSTSKNGTYKKMSSVAANKVSYTTAKLKSGKTYYFKVRTYKTVGDVKVYSSFSSIKSIKIK